MKKGILAVVFALLLGVSAPARDPEPRFELKPDTVRRTTPGFTLPDSLSHLSPWKPDYRTMEPLGTKPAVSMTSVVVIQRENLPSRVTVIDNNTLRLGPHFNLSNGQAWNWGSFPNAYLDARTLSFPMAR